MNNYIKELNLYGEYFRNKNIIITGAGTGYGRALSIAFLSYGSNVILIGRRESKLLETISLIEEDKLKNAIVLPLPCDITSSEEIKNTIQKVKNKFETVDILINCAAIPAKNDANLTEISEKRWDDMLNVNLKAQWLISKAVFPLMKNKIARMLFFTSGAGWADTNGYGLYNVSKTALNSLTASMAKEYEINFPTKIISINGINPGEAKTQMNKGSEISPYTICEMTFRILSTTKNIPNGKFFHRDGSYIRFCNMKEYEYEME